MIVTVSTNDVQVDLGCSCWSPPPPRHSLKKKKRYFHYRTILRHETWYMRHGTWDMKLVAANQNPTKTVMIVSPWLNDRYVCGWKTNGICWKIFAPPPPPPPPSQIFTVLNPVWADGREKRRTYSAYSSTLDFGRECAQEYLPWLGIMYVHHGSINSSTSVRTAVLLSTGNIHVQYSYRRRADDASSWVTADDRPSRSSNKQTTSCCESLPFRSRSMIVASVLLEARLYNCTVFAFSPFVSLFFIFFLYSCLRSFVLSFFLEDNNNNHKQASGVQTGTGSWVLISIYMAPQPPLVLYFWIRVKQQ